MSNMPSVFFKKIASRGRLISGEGRRVKALRGSFLANLCKCSLCTDSPPLTKNRGESLSPHFFLRGEGGVCTQASVNIAQVVEHDRQGKCRPDYDC